MLSEAKTNPCVSEPQGQETKSTPMTRAEIRVAREAYAAGLRAAGYLPSVGAKFAAEKYPLPKITVSREVEFAGSRYRYVNGRFEFKNMDGYWTASHSYQDIAGFKALAGLIDNPTCEVDA